MDVFIRWKEGSYVFIVEVHMRPRYASIYNGFKRVFFALLKGAFGRFVEIEHFNILANKTYVVFNLTHGNQINHILVSNNYYNVRSFRGRNVDKDHLMVIAVH